MILASSIDLIAHLGWRKAVVALDIGWMHAFAFEFALLKPVIEGDVSSVGDELFVEAVYAFGVWAVLT